MTGYRFSETELVHVGSFRLLHLDGTKKEEKRERCRVYDRDRKLKFEQGSRVGMEHGGVGDDRERSS